MLAINFFTKDIKFSLKRKTDLRAWLAATAKKEGFEISELNYIFCSDKFLYNINKKYLHHDDYTDIITFDLSTRHPEQKVGLTGEIFISIHRIKENAKLYNTTFHNEINRVMIHGVLHLCGYKDKTKAQKATMRKKEEFYISRF